MQRKSDNQDRLRHHHADLLIKGGMVATPNGLEPIDLACLDGQIVSMHAAGWAADDVIHAQGLHVLPGVIDTQVHFREPGLVHKENFEAGTRGAVLGGITTIFEMPNTSPLTITEVDLLAKVDMTIGRAWCDFAFYMGGSFGDLLAEEDEVLSRILRHGKRRLAVHAEDEARLRERRAIVEASGDVRDHPIWRDGHNALRATQRIVSISQSCDRRLHVLHVSTADEMTFLAQHKARVTVEVLPHHLTFCAPECYERLGTLAQMNPPVRDAHHQAALWEAVRDGTVDVLGSDHAPHTLAEKARPYPQSSSGMPGVQTLLAVMLNHVNQSKLSLERLIDLTSAGPARVFGIESKGRLALGYDADLVLVNLSARRIITNQSMANVSGWTPYDGMQVTGWPIATVLRGRCVMRDDEMIGLPSGRAVRFLEVPRLAVRQ